MGVFSEDCSNISRWLIVYQDYTTLATDGSSLFPSTTHLDNSVSPTYFDLDASQSLKCFGDFEINVNLTIPDFPITIANDSNFDIYINTVGNTGGNSTIDFYFYTDNSTGLAYMYVYGWMNLAQAITIPLPYTGTWKAKRVGTTVSFWMDDTQIYTVENSTGFYVDSFDLYWYVSNGDSPAPIDFESVKVNDIQATWTGVPNISSLKNAIFDEFTTSPTFSSTTYSYTADVSYNTTTAHFTPTLSDVGATMTVNGIVQTSGTSIPIDLIDGANTLTVVILAQDGVTTKTYTWTLIKRATPSNISTLGNIYVSGFTLSPSFNTATYSYTSTVGTNKQSISMRIVPTDKYAKVTVNGVSITSYTAYKGFNIIDGQNTFTIVTTSEDNLSSNTYTIIVTRPPTNVCTLSNLIINTHNISSASTDQKMLTLSPTFDRDNVFEYTVTNIDWYDCQISVGTITPTDSYATIYFSGSGMEQLYAYNQSGEKMIVSWVWRVHKGDNTLTVRVVAPNGIDEKTYIVHMNVPYIHQYQYGDGTEVNPYQIWTPEDMDGMRYYCGTELNWHQNNSNYHYWTSFYFKQMCDIDLSQYNDWKPIMGSDWHKSSYPEGWCSFFDGNNFRITGLKMNVTLDPATWAGYGDWTYRNFEWGFFGRLESYRYYQQYRLKNINLVDVDLTITSISDHFTTSDPMIGVLVGYIESSNCPIYNCHTSGKLTCNLYRLNWGGIGGLIGYGQYNTTTLYRCSSNVDINLTVTGSNTYTYSGVGGLIGLNRAGASGEITNSITGIQECFSTGNIYFNRTATLQNVGGLIGSTVGVSSTDPKPTYYSVTNCYSMVNLYVDGVKGVGGLTGESDQNILNSYYAGTIDFATGATMIGGIVGDPSTANAIPVDIISSYYDDTIIGTVLPTPTNGTPKNTHEMKMKSTYVGWDFTTIWKIDPNLNYGYPFLQWQPVNVTVSTKRNPMFSLKKNTLASSDIPVDSISSSYDSSALIKTDGTLWICGSGQNQKLGLGSSTQNVFQFTQVGTDTDWWKVYCGLSVTIAIKKDKTLWGSGYNQYWQFGDRSGVYYFPYFTQIGTDNDWEKVSIGFNHVFYQKSDKSIWVAGHNLYGELGLGSTNERIAFSQHPLLSNIKDFSCGDYNSFVIKEDGTLWGAGDTCTSLGNTHSFTQIGTDNDWEKVTTNGLNFFLIKSNGTLWGCGKNSSGELGVGSQNYINEIVQVGTDADWKCVVRTMASSNGISIAHKNDGTVYGCGYNNNSGTYPAIWARLGLPYYGCVTVFTKLTYNGNDKWISVKAGTDQSIGIGTDFQVYATGYAKNGASGTNQNLTKFTKVNTFGSSINKTRVRNSRVINNVAKNNAPLAPEISINKTPVMQGYMDGEVGVKVQISNWVQTSDGKYIAVFRNPNANGYCTAFCNDTSFIESDYKISSYTVETIGLDCSDSYPPSLLKRADGKILMFASTVKTLEGNVWIKCFISNNGLGTDWELYSTLYEFTVIPPNVATFGNHITATIISSAGRILVQAITGISWSGDTQTKHSCMIYRSDDNGLTWTKLYENSSIRAIGQPAVLADGTIFSPLSTSLDVSIHRSTDNGITWEPHIVYWNHDMNGDATLEYSFYVDNTNKIAYAYSPWTDAFYYLMNATSTRFPDITNWAYAKNTGSSIGAFQVSYLYYVENTFVIQINSKIFNGAISIKDDKTRNLYYLLPYTPIILENPNVYGTPANDYFSNAVAISDNYVVVTAEYEAFSQFQTSSGVVYVYNYSGNLIHTIQNPSGYSTQGGDRFGNALSTFGDRLLTGTWSESSSAGTFTGIAYLFDLTSGSLLYTFYNPHLQNNGYFGIGVAISSQYIAIGACGDNTDGTNSGRVYLYDATNYSLVATLANPNVYTDSTRDFFGNEVCLTEDYLAINALTEDESKGAVHIFNVHTRELLWTLVNPEGYHNGEFTERMSAYGDKLLVGDKYANGQRGQAYLYDMSTGELLHTFIGEEYFPWDGNYIYFGSSVSLSKDYGVIGAMSGSETLDGENWGAFIVIDPNTYELITKRFPPNLDTRESINTVSFGDTVAIQNGTIVVGDSDFNDGVYNNNSGRAYIYSIDGMREFRRISI